MDSADTSFFGEIDGETANGTASHNLAVTPRQGLEPLGEILSKKNSYHGDVLTGYYVGGGTDLMLFKNVSMGVEYRHVEWGNTDVGFASGGPVFPGGTNYGVSADQVMFKVNIMIAQFNPFH
jgi:opacity protein-like surface antigen